MVEKNKRSRLHVLVDADVLVALSKKDDSNHLRASKILRELMAQDVIFSISPMTIAEVVTVLSHKVSQKSAKVFLHAVREVNFDELECSPLVLELADRWFLKQEKKGTSYFDCTNMALAEQYHLDGIFSFDQTYKKNGFTVFN